MPIIVEGTHVTLHESPEPWFENIKEKCCNNTDNGSMETLRYKKMDKIYYFIIVLILMLFILAILY